MQRTKSKPLSGLYFGLVIRVLLCTFGFAFGEIWFLQL